MKQKRRRPGILVLVAVGASLSACHGEVLSFDSSASVGLDKATTQGSVAALSDEEASQLCAWIYASYPGAPVAPNQLGYSVAPGYVGGEFSACYPASPAPPASHGFASILLLPDDCVLNLRHAPCTATVASLEQCVSAFATHFFADPDPCPAIEAACATYLSVPSCDETVIQSSPGVGAGGGCGSGLPIEPDVSCTSFSQGFLDGGCVVDTTVACSGDASGYACSNGNNPVAPQIGSPPPTVSCTTPVPDASGNDDYCCIPWGYGSAACTPDNTLSLCGPGTYAYSCSRSDTPGMSDSALTCATGVPDSDGVHTDYCCQLP